MNADPTIEQYESRNSATLIRVTIEDLARAERRVNVLMGDRSNHVVSGLRIMSSLR